MSGQEMLPLVPESELRRRVAVAQALHVPGKRVGNQAPPRCTECGFPFPCATWLALNGPRSTETPPQRPALPQPPSTGIVAMSGNLRLQIGNGDVL